jgi:hypothetical protein
LSRELSRSWRVTNVSGSAIFRYFVVI